MKRFLVLLLALAAICTTAKMEGNETQPTEPDGGAQRACAAAQALPTGAFTLLSQRAPYDPDAPAAGEFYNGQIDLDGDGAAEEVAYAYAYSEEDGLYAYTLRVDGLKAERGDAMYLTGELGAVRFSGVEGAFLLVADNGASDDPTSYIYHYTTGEAGASLEYLGTVDAFASDMTVTGRNTFSTYVRASTLFTWYRPAEFVLATGYHWDEDGGQLRMSYGVAEVPRELYPVGAHVTLKMDLPLQTSHEDATVCRTLHAGETAVLAATDDRQWYYIAAPASDAQTPAGGWIRLAPDGISGVLVGGETIDGSDLFDGLLYAD